jgi:hypothetical protein
MTAVQTFDFSPLSAPVDSAAVAALRRESVAHKVAPNTQEEALGFGLSIAAFIVDTGILLFIDLGFLPLITKVLFTAIMGTLDVLFLFGIFYAGYRLSVRWAEFYRAKQFAAVNAMTYAVSESKPTWNSLVFNREAARSGASSVFTTTSEPVFEAGNYFYENLAAGKLVRTDWGYAVVDLGRTFPRMMLRSTSRLSAKRFGHAAFAGYPVLPLGGRADRAFTLYCPSESEDEARSLFTPEFIAALQKVGRSVDVEVSGQFLFIYSSKRFAFPRPRVVAAVFAALSLANSLTRTA